MTIGNANGRDAFLIRNHHLIQALADGFESGMLAAPGSRTARSIAGAIGQPERAVTVFLDFVGALPDPRWRERDMAVLQSSVTRLLPQAEAAVSRPPAIDPAFRARMIDGG